VLLLDQAGWYTTRKLHVPGNITLLPLPARSPELNPVENLWQFLRDHWLGNRIFRSYADILDQCCNAWNRIVAQPRRITSIGMRRWAYAC
jgi:putative transposase